MKNSNEVPKLELPETVEELRSLRNHLFEVVKEKQQDQPAPVNRIFNIPEREEEILRKVCTVLHYIIYDVEFSVTGRIWKECICHPSTGGRPEKPTTEAGLIDWFQHFRELTHNRHTIESFRVGIKPGVTLTLPGTISQIWDMVHMEFPEPVPETAEFNL